MEDVRPRRITLVDALRGYALMGLFLIHMVEYFELYWYRPEPHPVNSAMFFLFGGKAYAMFALLFGVSFFIIMQSQARKGVDFRARFVWRLSLLLVMGYLHGLVYGGDILQVLAVTGLLLVPLYHRSNAALFWMALFFLAQIPGLILFMAAEAGALNYARPLHASLQPAVFEVYAHGSLADVLSTNMWSGQAGKWAFMLESGRIGNIIGFSLLGFLLARVGVFSDAGRYKRACVRGFLVSVLLSGVLLTLEQPLLRLARGNAAPWIFGNVVSAYVNHALLAVTLFGLMLWYQTRFGARLLGLLAPCGRVSLTIYVSQSLLLVPVFYGYGLGAYAFMGQPVSLALGLVLWCLQVALAHYWVQRYHYGPAEWLWRAVTWLRFDIPFKRRTTEERLDRAAQTT